MIYTYQFKFYNPGRPCSPQEAVKAIEGLLACEGARATDYERDWRRHRLSPGHPFDPRVAVEPDGRSSVGLLVPCGPQPVDILFQTFPAEAKGAFAALSIGGESFEEDSGQVAALLLDLAKVVNLHLPVFFAWGDHELELARLEKVLSFDRVAALAWANLFSPKLADRLGRERLIRAPAYQMLTFKQGVLYLLAPDPTAPPQTSLLDQVAAYFPNCLVSGKHT